MVLEYSKKESGEFIFVCTEESEMGALFRYYIPRTKYHKMFWYSRWTAWDFKGYKS